MADSSRQIPGRLGGIQKTQLTGGLGLHHCRHRISLDGTEGDSILRIFDAGKGLVHGARCRPPRCASLTLDGTQRVVSRSDCVIVEFVVTLKGRQDLSRVTMIDQGIPARPQRAEQPDIRTYGALRTCQGEGGVTVGGQRIDTASQGLPALIRVHAAIQPDRASLPRSVVPRLAAKRRGPTMDGYRG